MDEEIRQKILKVLGENKIMSVATLRPDGWPQATTVGYANEGMTLYFLCAPDSQKAANLAHDNRVSLTINADAPQVMAIIGVSMAARAETITDPDDARHVLGLLMARYPEQANLPGPVPGPQDIRLIRLIPEVISLIDYSKGFGHTDLVGFLGTTGA